MNLHVEIPESIVSAMRLPEPEIPARIREELAVSLYSGGILSFGKARELAHCSHHEFGQLLGRRGVLRHYGEEELEEDLEYAGGQ